MKDILKDLLKIVSALNMLVEPVIMSEESFRDKFEVKYKKENSANSYSDDKGAS